MKRNYS